MKENAIVVGDRSYRLDDCGCLENFHDWQPEFAEAMAAEVGIALPLTDLHHRFIRFLRENVQRTGRAPIVHRACREFGLKLWELEKLFPCGYHRGACRLAGLNYFDRYTPEAMPPDKIYRIDGRGFLVDPLEWDEHFAVMRGEEFQLTLTDDHWQVIRFLRRSHAATGLVPTVFDTCRECKLELDRMERLFPQGYQRCAVKIAGLSLTHQPKP